MSTTSSTTGTPGIGYIKETTYSQDSEGNIIKTTVTTYIQDDDSLPSASQPVAAVLASADTDQPEVTQSSHGNWLSSLAGSVWNTPLLRYLTLGVAATGLGVGLYLVLHSGGSTKGSGTTKTTLTPAQAAVAQNQLARAIANTTGLLQAAGYSAQTIHRAQTQVALDYGSRIALATVVPASTKMSIPLYVIGSGTPAHYANFDTLNVRAYVSSMSRSPTPNDITKNSAAVHDLRTTVAP
jgi:hypothetical protein